MRAAALHGREEARVDTVERLRLLEPACEEEFDRLTRLIKAVLGVEIAAFSIIDTDRQFFKSSQGLSVSETPRDIAFCAHAILKDEILLIEDAHLDERFFDNPLVTDGPKIRFYAGIPILAHNRLPVGTLCAIDSQPRKLAPEHAHLLKDLRAILEESLLLRSLSVKDHLTGLYNRRYFDEAFQDEWRRAYRNQTPMSLMMVDVDYFKAYNDVYGHPQGDRCLAEVARVLMGKVARSGDLVARFGGEEFAVVMPDTNAADASLVGERLRAAVRGLTLPHAGAPAGLVTVSVGVAVLDGLDPEHQGSAGLLSAADEALYEAKRTGRDRVVLGGTLAFG